MARKSSGEVLERRSELLKQLKQNIHMSVDALSDVLEVSEVTVRRDLQILEAEGKLERTRGGALFAGATDTSAIPQAAESDLLGDSEEAHANSDAAKRIARLAVERIRAEDVVLLSGGPISEEIARVCLSKKDVVIITNSVRVFKILEINRRIHLISTGGELRHTSGTLVGPIAETSIQNIRADRLILEPSGISESNELYCSSLPDVPVLQAMIHAARDVTVVAEQHAFNREVIMQITSVSVATEIITDSLEKKTITRLEAGGITVVTT